MNGEILVVAEHMHGELSPITRQAITAATELRGGGGGSVALALLASDPPALTTAASLSGIDVVIQVPVAEPEFNADLYAGTVEALVRERSPSVVMMGFTTNGMAVAPVVAARTGSGFASDVVACDSEDGELLVRRPFYGGKVEAELDFPGHHTVVLLLRPNTWAEALAGGSPDVVASAVAPVDSATRMRHREFLEPPTDGIDISKANIILAIGRGIGEQENIPRLEALADRMGVTLAASRPLVDAGWISRVRQVGQSGVTVKPKLYVALGISGAVQHLTGMKASERIVAVNQDPQAPIFNVASYGAVEDLFDVVEELEKRWE